MEIERRFAPLGEIRISIEGGKPVLRGVASVFNSDSVDLGGFTESLMRFAFRNALTKSDPRCLRDHIPHMILGRSSAKTLRISESDGGLPFDCDMPDTSYARDLQVSMGRGDVRECSFSFKVRSGGDKWEKRETGIWHRTIMEDGIDELYDVSPVTFPAYPDTSCALRSLDKIKAAEIPAFDDTVSRKLNFNLVELYYGGLVR